MNVWYYYNSVVLEMKNWGEQSWLVSWFVFACLFSLCFNFFVYLTRCGDCGRPVGKVVTQTVYITTAITKI